MKGQENVPLTVKLLGREYQVACPVNERDQLLASARYLDDRMQAIRKRAAGLGVERIAVMTALNMAREMMAKEQQGDKPVVVPLTNAASSTASAAPAADEDRMNQLQLRIDAELHAK